ncbi:flippase activity-associated protein Agl23 [Halarchaeum sp. P4]|uniref:flippase activity-associated protein Agl23 n=1 Tax=Halarchaeum sp. P4 TaxID=3421639 RepID=UPI003EC09436
MSDSDRRVAAGVVAVTAVALIARLVSLGFRVAHWDEGRVGYWILRYMETGQYTYHPIVHGPFLFHVNQVVFDLFGASDTTMRLVVAVVGGLLPLTAWLLRERFSTAETVSLAVLLAANPLLLYYSRFMRSDVLVGAFALFALAFVVRAHDTGDRRHLYAGALSLALAFTTKENVLIYVACWVGALVLLLDWMLLSARHRGEDPKTVFSRRMLALARGLRPWARDVAGSAVLFLLVVVFFYAPRPELWRAFSDPTLFPSVVARATAGSVQKFVNTWVGGHPHSYVEFFVHDVETLAAGAAAVCLLGVAGFVYDRYTDDHPRPLVAFAGYWALASMVIYPAVSDISAPWAMVHVVIPLAIPAAVGAGLLLSTVAATRRAEDDAGTVIAVALVVTVVGWMAVTGLSTAFLHPQEPGPLVQYGQPNGNLHPAIAEIDDAVQAHQGESGPDVLYYGEHFYAASEPSVAPDENFSEPGHWTWRLPLPWYFEGMGAQTASTTQLSALNGTTPPVVITRAENYDEVASYLEGYDAATYELTATGTPTVFFVRDTGSADGNATAGNATNPSTIASPDALPAATA